MHGGTALWQQATPGGTPQELLLAEVRALRQEVARLGAPSAAGFLPDAVRALPGPVVPLQFGLVLLACVRVEYQGHVLYHHAERQLLLLDAGPGGYQRVASAQQLAQLVARSPDAKPAKAADDAGSGPADEAFLCRLLAGLPSAEERAAEAALQAALQAISLKDLGAEVPARIPLTGKNQGPDESLAVAFPHVPPAGT